MRWTIHAAATTFGLFMLAANIQPAAAQQNDHDGSERPAKRAVREERDRITDAAFSSTVDEQGNGRFSITLGDFTLEKVLASSGEATIRLSQGKDAVSIAMTHNGYVVARGKKTARFDAQAGSQTDLDAVRSVLLGSQAVRTFRRLNASMENRDDSDDEGPLFLSALVDGAIVQMLDGDSGATERIGKRITRRQRAAVRQARLKPDNLFTDCVLRYEMSLVDAWDLFSQCRDTAWTLRWYVWYGAENLCELEWLIRSQQYIYQFMTCFAFPF